MKFKEGDVVSPKPGTYHHRTYGAFIAQVVKVDECTYYFKVIDAGKGTQPVIKTGDRYDFNTIGESADKQFEISLIYHSPLYQALL